MNANENKDNKSVKFSGRLESIILVEPIDCSLQHELYYQQQDYVRFLRYEIMKAKHSLRIKRNQSELANTKNTWATKLQCAQMQSGIMNVSSQQIIKT